MKVIVMTGATSGIGAEAMKHLTKQPDTLIIVGARGSGRTAAKGTEVLPLEPSSLKSVRSFAEEVERRLGNTPIDILILNGGATFGLSYGPVSISLLTPGSRSRLRGPTCR